MNYKNIRLNHQQKGMIKLLESGSVRSDEVTKYQRYSLDALASKGIAICDDVSHLTGVKDDCVWYLADEKRS